MPRYTIFIKEDDNATWLAIPDRPAWIADKLRQDRLTNEYMKAVKATAPLPVIKPKKKD